MSMTLERAAEIIDPAHREHYQSIELVNEACEIGRRAILKQIPRQVDITEDCCICQNCHFDMMGVYDFSDRDTKDPSYCPKCGQALDWGENR